MNIANTKFDCCLIYMYALFDLLRLYIPVNIFQLCQDGSSQVEPVLSKD